MKKIVSYIHAEISAKKIVHTTTTNVGACVNMRDALQYTHMNSVTDEKSFSPDTPHQSSSSLFGYALFALGFALIIRFFVATPFIVHGSSMENSFHQYDYLLIDRVTYRFEAPQRGDVIVFGLPQEQSRDLIKRIVGLPGETVKVTGAVPTVIIVNAQNPEGFTLSEPYLDPANFGNMRDMEVKLGEAEYFVLGDNRRVSADSRVWGILPREDIIGRVLVRLYPLSHASVLPGEARYLME